MAKDLKDQSLIDQLVAEAEPVRALPSLLKRLALWLLAASTCIAIGVLWFGIRQDLGIALMSTTFIVETLAALALTVAAAAAALLLSIPGETIKPAQRWAIFMSIGIWVTLFAVMFYRGAPMQFNFASDTRCFSNIIILGIVPGLVLFFLIRQAAPTKPTIIGLLSSLATIGIATFGMAMVCPDDSASHRFFGHFFPLLIIGGLGSLLGRWIWKW